MKIEIEYPKNSAKSIVISSISFLKNRVGQWVVDFNCASHKYLNVDYNTSTNAPNNHITDRNAQGFTLATQDGSDAMYIWLIPENGKESIEVEGVAAILPLKWAYSAVIVPFTDFDKTLK
jgi:hypothetical protein